MVTDPHPWMKKIMKTRHGLIGLTLAAAMTAAGCSEDATAPGLLDEALTYHAAIVAADATLEDLALARSTFSFGPGAAQAPGGGPGPAGRPGGGMGVGGAFSGTRSATFYDEGGNVQDRYDPLTTARIHYLLEIEGEVERGPWSGSVSRTRDMTVSGLLGRETARTHDGSGSESVQRSRTLEDGGEVTFDMTGTFTVAGLVVPAPGSEPHYPLSGTITRTLKVSATGGPRGDVSREVTVVVTFDGDATATVVVNGETHEIDLDARPGADPFKGLFGRNGRGNGRGG